MCFAHRVVGWVSTQLDAIAGTRPSLPHCATLHLLNSTGVTRGVSMPERDNHERRNLFLCVWRFSWFESEYCYLDVIIRHAPFCRTHEALLWMLH